MAAISTSSGIIAEGRINEIIPASGNMEVMIVIFNVLSFFPNQSVATLAGAFVKLYENPVIKLPIKAYHTDSRINWRIQVPTTSSTIPI